VSDEKKKVSFELDRLVDYGDADLLVELRRPESGRATAVRSRETPHRR
jgi:hypothetical protein